VYEEAPGFRPDPRTERDASACIRRPWPPFSSNLILSRFWHACHTAYPTKSAYVDHKCRRVYCLIIKPLGNGTLEHLRYVEALVAGAYTRPLLSSSYWAVLITRPRVPLSNSLGGSHAPNVSHKMCLR